VELRSSGMDSNLGLFPCAKRVVHCNVKAQMNIKRMVLPIFKTCYLFQGSEMLNS